MKRFFSLLLIAVLTVTLCACAKDDKKNDGGDEFYDPSFFVTFPDTENLKLAADANTLQLYLSNGSDVDISAGGAFTVANGTGTVGTGTVELTNVRKNSSGPMNFDFAHLNLTAGYYTVTVSYTWTQPGGTIQTKQVSFTFEKKSADPAPEPEPEPNPDRDITKLNISDLTKEERDELAQYLFQNYIPCCFGIFSSPAELSSASIWASVETLNSVLDKDTSEQSHTLADVKEKVDRYYPGAEFKAESVRLYNKDTKTFRTSPIVLEDYKYLSYEITGGQITVYYEDVPEDEDTAPGQYATTLKNSAAEGYFSFVSTKRVGAVG